jgi:hypothetical protein
MEESPLVGHGRNERSDDSATSGGVRGQEDGRNGRQGSCESCVFGFTPERSCRPHHRGSGVSWEITSFGRSRFLRTLPEFLCGWAETAF